MKTIKDARYSMNHTQDRVWERYNIFIGDPDYIEMCRRVRDKIDVKFISEEKRKKNIQQIYDIPFKNTTIRVVWSTERQCITTALPM